MRWRPASARERVVESADAARGTVSPVAGAGEMALHQLRANPGIVIYHQHQSAVVAPSASTGPATSISALPARHFTGSLNMYCECRAFSPGAPATVMSPPIKRQNWRLMARPEPGSAELLLVDESVRANASNSLADCSGVSAYPGVAHLVDDVVSVAPEGARRASLLSR